MNSKSGAVSPARTLVLKMSIPSHKSFVSTDILGNSLRVKEISHLLMQDFPPEMY
jgi:hypothetical protein